ncbi:hypothetical protein DBV05_g5318 [Lasiodiplodia theobromae]|uniref:DNA replication regulator Sld3 C-terminal domain-containing protein n=1 Tax=Lasiodiplodia theobromae TaxID=45133 RepID=A0A5N5DDZ9_9PEZI|nr:hypothetical protein DBV05_g5318 [Lasiodiplodia theobromae]
MVSANKYDSLTPARPATSSSTAAKTRKPPAESRKRKRGDHAPEALAQKLITIRLIDRSQLPLSFLDVIGPSGSLPSTRLFSAYVEALECHAPESKNAQEQEEDVPATPKVLVTRFEADNGSLYAVERVRRGVYALCRLGAWVKEEDVGAVRAHPAGLPYAQPLKALRKEDGRLWWQRVAVASPPSTNASTTPVDRAEGHGAAPRLSMRRPVPKIVHAAPKRLEDADPFVDSAEQAGQLPVGDVEERPQTAEEVFQTVVQQYLEALYLTKTSLAFFVKGPMSRARAAFMSKENAGLKMGDLAAFMRSILLQPGPMDKKHREKLPEIVKSMPLPGLSDDEDMAAAKMEKKKKSKSKSKKLKPNKEGLYPGEDEHVKKWWLQDRPGTSPHGHSESPADILKRRLGDLRVRESMAQVILVLEIMALEASPSFQATEQEETQQDETQAESQAAPVKKRKPKKPQDLNVLLDLLLDRLCIWQSVEQDETLVKAPQPGSGKNDVLTPSSDKSGTSDKLKNFCVEVILPFYMSRMPEKAAAINKRLGGPSASPAKSSSSGSSTNRSKPGEAAVRTDPRAAQKKRRPLSRVATENAAHQPQRHPSLTRSSTDPLLPANLKREGSEAPSLSSIPLQQKDSKTSSSRNSLSQFERFSRRTIDLDAMAKSNEAKLKKKAHIEQELEKAIGTLRKPNRGAALKDVADSADSRRQLSTAQSSRSSTKPGAPVTRKVGGGSNILVGATPKRGRKTKDVILQATPNHNRFSSTLAAPAIAAARNMDEDEDADASLPLASDPIIPSSAVRPGPVDVIAPTSYSTIPGSVVKNASSSSASARRSGGVEETPSRGPAGKTVHWFLPSGSADRGAEASVIASTPEAKAGGMSRLGDRLKASAGGRSGGDGLLKVPPPPPAFRMPGAPVSRRGANLAGEEESEGSEDEYRGVAALMRTPTKAGRGQVLETPVKRAVAVGETPVKGAVGEREGGRESKGKEKEVEGGGMERIEEEEGAEESIYNVLGWDDVDELAF